MKEIAKIETDSFILYGYNKYYERSVSPNDPFFILHCEDGPAEINKLSNTVAWFVDGVLVGDLVQEWFEEHNIDDWKTMSEEDKHSLSFYMRSL